MLELFSRQPEGISLADDTHLTPLPIDEEAASLSAILLDGAYYEFLKSMVRTLDGIPVLDEAAIIPFKARAWLDLSRRRDEGEKIDEKDVRKHRNDVARMLQLLAADASYALPSAVRDDMRAFVQAVAVQENFDPRQFDVSMTRDVVVERLRAAYRL